MARKKLPEEMKRVRRNYTFSPETAEYLDKKPNASAYLEKLVRADIEKERRDEYRK